MLPDGLEGEHIIRWQPGIMLYTEETVAATLDVSLGEERTGRAPIEVLQ